MAGASLPLLLPALYPLPSRCLWRCPPGKFHTPIFFTPYFKPHVNKAHSLWLPMPPNKADICSMTVNILNKLSFPSYPRRLSQAAKKKKKVTSTLKRRKRRIIYRNLNVPGAPQYGQDPPTSSEMLPLCHLSLYEDESHPSTLASVGEKKSFSLYLSRFLAENSPQ